MWGFAYQPLDFSQWLFVIFSISLVTTFLPLTFARPSGLILFILYLLVYLPTLIITVATKSDSINIYGAPLMALTAGLSFVCISTRLFSPKTSKHPVHLRRCVRFFFIVSWVALLIFLVYSFHGVMNLVGLDNIYSQRELGRSQNLAQGYAQTYFAYVFSPALLAFGLHKKKYGYLVLALIGFLMMFAITAERTLFLMPFAMVVLNLALRSNISHHALMVGTLTILSIITIAASSFEGQNSFFGLLALYLVFRTIAVPGAMLPQYHDVFSESGYTFWSNISGIKFISDAPAAYYNDASWPQLGYIVADRVLGVVSNSNANLFAYDGVAAAGFIGVLLVCILLGIWLIALDKVARNVDYKFSALVLFPIAFALTNGSLFSILLSFGGLFWIAAFFIVSTRKTSFSD
jgi:oligosaccharide repeat unit polymerase